MTETTYFPQELTRRQLEDFLYEKIVLARPYGVSQYQPWSMNEQVTSAILQIKMAIAYNAGRKYKEISFDKGDDFADNDNPAIIGLHSGQLTVPCLKNPSPLLKLAVRAFAEVAGEDPNKVTVCSAMRAGFWRSALNLLKEPTCIAVIDEATAKRLIDFAENTTLKSPLNSRFLIFEKK